MAPRAHRRRPSAALLLALVGLVSTGCFEDSPSDPFETSPTSGAPATGSSSDSGNDASTGHGSSTSPSSTGSADSTGSTTPEPDSSTGDSQHVPCPAGSIDGPLPVTIDADTSEQHDELAGSCGGGSAPELGYTFTAPAAGSYVFDTGGSAVDTVLYLLDGVCEGPELGCNDDGLAGSNASLTSVTLGAGQTITVVVDAFGVSGGAVRLTVSEGNVGCPAQVVPPGLPQTVLDQTLIATDQFESSCGTADEGDQAFTFTAPTTGIYRFDTGGSDFDTTLFVLDGSCEGRELACNDDAPGTFDGRSGLALPLQAGQEVTAVVEGFLGQAGNLALNVSRLSGTCPDEDLGSQPLPFVVMGSTLAADEASAGSCGGLGGPDYSYEWTAPTDAVVRFDTAGSGFDTVLYLLEGSCLGPERVCNDDAGGTAAAASAYLLAGQTVEIVIDGTGAAGDFMLTVEETTDSGDCCTPRMEPGCEQLPIQVCVCTMDAYCCNTSWDAMCVNAAVDSCGAICL
ncbi:MAG: PPC domain-containing protein [Myxococcales bacterium]|nr:PPC domain-containing protein [Myxococcales bacterium]MCB9714531.1 PPC domain-containing protein [Myxococcales bacterium]